MDSGRSHAEVIRNPTLLLESVNDDRCRVWSLQRGDSGIQMSSRVLQSQAGRESLCSSILRVVV
jgi:hypothetical protein